MTERIVDEWGDLSAQTQALAEQSSARLAEREQVAENRRHRLRAAGQVARAAEERGDSWAANEAWRTYRLIRDAGRDPDELLAEGVELSRVAMELAAQDAASGSRKAPESQ